MATWVMSVVSVVVLMALLDLFMAEGKTKKYIKGIMSIIVIAVIIAPLPKILNKNISISEVFNIENSNNNLSADNDYLFRLYSAQYTQKERKIEDILYENGIEGAVVKINIYQFDEQISVINVLVSLQKAVITTINKNININDTIYAIVNKVVIVSQEQVVIYG